MRLRSFCAALAVSLLSTAHAQAPIHTLLSPTPRGPGQFGAKVIGVPDLDGDGRGDLVVGAQWEANLAGRVHVYSGASGTLIRTLQSPTPRVDLGQFGLALAAVPDLDGDGVWDLAVGTSAEGNTVTGFGRVHVFSGATGTLVRSLISPQPEFGGQAFPSFGVAVAGVPDVDGDGFGDLLVGAMREGTGDSGRAYLFSGATGALLLTMTTPNPETNGYFGGAVSSVPDADGDGVADLLVGAWNEDAGATNAGRAYLFSGATGALLRTFVSPSPTSQGIFGFSLQGVADVDGDGRGDVLVGASGESAPHLTSGRAYLFSGSTGALLRTYTSPNAVQSGNFGASVAGVPDVDGDGREDHLVGAFGEMVGALRAGRAHIYSGATGVRLGSVVSPNPEASGAFGAAVSGVPDASGDGRGEVLVGAPAEDGGLVNEGRAYLFSGGALVSDEPGISVSRLTLSAAPNPTRDAVALVLDVPVAGEAVVEVFDPLGRRVALLHRGTVAAGRYTFTVEGLPPGVHVVRATAAGETVVHRITQVR